MVRRLILEDNGMCFGCGTKNPIGLKLDFKQEGDEFFTFYKPAPEFQGYAGALHGGIISTLLDEVMANHLLSQGYIVVTAELTVRFLKPVPIGQTIKISSHSVNCKRKIWEMAGQVADNLTGEILAKAKAKFFIVQEMK